MNLNKRYLGNIKFAVSNLFSFISIIILSKIAEECFLIKDINYGFIIFLVFIGAIAYFIIFKLINRKIYRVLFIIICIILMGSLFVYKKEVIIKFLNLEILNNIYILYDSIYNAEVTFFFNYKPILIIFLPISYMIILFISNMIYMNFISLLNFLVLISLWIMDRELCNKYVYIILLENFIFTVVSLSISMCSKDIKLSDKVNVRKSIIWVIFIPIIVQFTFVVKVMPIERRGKLDENQYDVFLKSALYGDRFQSKNYILERGFNLCTIGYSDTEKKLGGSIKLDNKQLMYIKAPKPYFLKGSVKDEYTGYSWHSTKGQDSINDHNEELDIYNLQNNKNNKSQYDKCNFYSLDTERINIKYKDDYMNGVFISPNMLNKISINQKGIIKYNNEQEIRFSDIIKSDYSLDVYNVRTAYDKDIPVGEEILQSKDKIHGYMDYKAVKVYSASEKWIDNFLYTDDDGMIKTLYERYVQLPNNIPYRVYELSNKITSGCYDTLDKVQHIKKYLEKNYKYSLNVNKNSKDEDFVDNFLFEEKKGYCTYFATAMTVLCRMQGIPARYVEGFNMHNVEKVGDEYVIGSECAHAWCEILVSPDQNIWVIADPKVTDISQLVAHTSVQSLNKEIKEEDQEKEKFRQRKLEKKQDKQVSSNENLNNTNVNKAHNTNRDFKKYVKDILSKYKLIAIVMLIIFIYIIIILWRYVKYIRILKDKSIIGLYKYYMKSLRQMGFCKESYMTDLEFAESLRGFSFYENILIVILETNQEYYGGRKSSIDRKKYYQYMRETIKIKNKNYK